MAETPRIASHWRRACAISIDRKTFAAVWMALDRAADVIYLYDEYSAPLMSLPVHADAVRSRGKWIPVLFDLRANGRSEEDGAAIGRRLDDLGVMLHPAPADEEVGILAINERLVAGRLRVVDTMTAWRNEYQTWQRTDDGEIPDDGGLLMRATALVVRWGPDIGITENQAASDAEGYDIADRTRSAVTGY